jgi:hypothetical protein
LKNELLTLARKVRDNRPVREVRPLSPVLLLVSALALACGGEFQHNPPKGNGGDEVDAPPGGEAETFFNENVLPIMEGKCANCHANIDGIPEFMGGDSVYESVTTWIPPLLSCLDPEQSYIITRGDHGGALTVFDTVNERPMVVQFAEIWAEHSEECDGETNTSGRARSVGIVPNNGEENEIDLSGLGPGLTDVRLAFRAEYLNGGFLYMSGIKLYVDETPIYMKAPRFEVCSGGAVAPNQENKFASEDRVITQSATGTVIGSGTLTFIEARLGDRVAISFEALHPEGTGSTDDAVDLGGACTP